MQQKEIKAINNVVERIILENPTSCVWRVGAELNVPITDDLRKKCMK